MDDKRGEPVIVCFCGRLMEGPSEQGFWRCTNPDRGHRGLVGDGFVMQQIMKRPQGADTVVIPHSGENVP